MLSKLSNSVLRGRRAPQPGRSLKETSPPGPQGPKTELLVTVVPRARKTVIEISLSPILDTWLHVFPSRARGTTVTMWNSGDFDR